LLIEAGEQVDGGIIGTHQLDRLDYSNWGIAQDTFDGLAHGGSGREPPMFRAKLMSRRRRCSALLPYRHTKRALRVNIGTPARRIGNRARCGRVSEAHLQIETGGAKTSMPPMGPKAISNQPIRSLDDLLAAQRCILILVFRSGDAVRSADEAIDGIS
jgi:hypothetical protein